MREHLFKTRLDEVIAEWIYSSPPVDCQKIIIGCDFADLARRIEKVFELKEKK